MDYKDFNIEIKGSKSTGEYQTTCPNCSHLRKKKTDKCLSVNLDKQTWYCHHCSFSGGLRAEKHQEVVYVKPVWKNQTQLSEKVVKWFESRGISQKTLTEMKISEGKEWMPQTQKEENTIQFNYFEGDVLINTKFRDGAKNFKMVKDAEKIPYNINGIEGSNRVIIVEGEMDVLSFYEAGFKDVISVPNGATIGKADTSYLDRFIDTLKQKTIVISTDNDNAGRSLLNALADRFGRSSCFWIDYGEFKDANEVLMAKGIQGIIDLKAHEFEIVGSLGVENYFDDVHDLLQNGLDEGARIGDNNLDEYLRFVKGYITTITGVPGHGKSEYVDHITISLIANQNWKGAYYSPENKPTKLHLSKMVRRLSGKGWLGANKVTPLEVSHFLNYLHDKIWFIKPPKGFSLDDILESAKELKNRKNIDFFVIDAWNKLEHNYDQNETKYIGQSLDKLAVFCEEYGLHCFLVAHPTKINKDKLGVLEVPNLYNIAGSAHFYNKSDNGITVYRRFSNENPNESTTEIYIQKVKFNHWGKVGMIEYDFDKPSLRYFKKGTFESGQSMLRQPTQSELPINTNFDNEKPPF